MIKRSQYWRELSLSLDDKVVSLRADFQLSKTLYVLGYRMKLVEVH